MKQGYLEHPERCEGEVFLGNLTLEQYLHNVKWVSKRMGVRAYDLAGEIVKELAPVFASAEEVKGDFPNGFVGCPSLEGLGASKKEPESKPFYGDFLFSLVDECLPPSEVVLTESRWRINSDNAPNILNRVEPKTGWSHADKLAIIGDINSQLEVGDDFIISTSSNFKSAGEVAGKLGFRPALAGEFLQLMWLLRKEYRHKATGWFFCYAGREPAYAILGRYEGRRGFTSDVDINLIFDTRIGNQVEKGHIKSSMENNCFFVRKH